MERDAQAAASEALIESSFRRLLAAIEGEREKIRSTWQEVDGEGDRIQEELEHLRQETEDWCKSEQAKVDEKQKELDKMVDNMTVQYADVGQILYINCSGKQFNLPLSALCGLDGSLLNHMFSKAFIKLVPRDKEGRYFLDFNPTCFGLIVESLVRRRPDQPAPPPLQIPPEQQLNMDLLVETLRLRAFMRLNRLNPSHGTSLRVTNENSVHCLDEGCQIISGQYPMSACSPSYFEAKVVACPGARGSAKGGLAVGVCGHLPKGAEVYSIRLKNAILYSSGNGLIGGNTDTSNVQPGIQLSEGSTLGIKYDPNTATVVWYFNKISIGSCVIAAESRDDMKVLYPILALFDTDQKVDMEFGLAGPYGKPATALCTA